MQKKGPRAIPDFSRHGPPKPGAHGPAPDGKRIAAPPPTPRATVKPQATNAKSGRRGA